MSILKSIFSFGRGDDESAKPLKTDNAGKLQLSNTDETNLFYKGNVINDTQINSSTGAFETKTDWKVSGYIAVDEKTTYVRNEVMTTGEHGPVHFYDADKLWLGSSIGLPNGDRVRRFTTPEKCHYIAVNLATEFVDITDDLVIKKQYLAKEIEKFTRQAAIGLKNVSRIHELFWGGFEHVSFIEGSSLGAGSVSKDGDVFTMEVSENDASKAHRTYVTDDLIDLSGVNAIGVDFELINKSQYLGRAYLVISQNKTGAPSTYEKRLGKIASYGDNVQRTTEYLNVSEYDGSYYIRLHVEDISGTDDVSCELIVYNIWRAMQPGSLLARDKDSGKFTEVSSIEDENGKHVLRVVDAAPFAYDPQTETISTNFASEQTILNDLSAIKSNQKEIERAIKLNANIRSDQYIEGTEYVDIVEGYTDGLGSVSKEREYLKLEVSGNDAQRGERVYVTDTAVDLTGINKVYLDYEHINESGYNASMYLIAGTNKTGSRSSYDARYSKLAMAESLPRHIEWLDVSGLTGNHYLRVHVRDSSTSVAVDSEIRVYGLWTEE